MIDPFGLIDLGNDCLLSGLKRLEEDLRRDSLLLCLLQIFRRDHRIGLSVMTPKILIKIIRKTIDLFGPFCLEYFSLISVGVKKSIPEGIVDLGRPKFALTENILLGNTLTLLWLYRVLKLEQAELETSGHLHIEFLSKIITGLLLKHVQIPELMVLFLTDFHVIFML